MHAQTALRTSLRRKFTQLTRSASLCLSLAVLVSPSARAATGTITGNAADAHANSDGTVTFQTSTFGRVGADSGIRHSVVHVFQIPPAILADPTQQFSAATYKIKCGMGSAMSINADLYGVGFSVAPAVQSADFYEGALDSTATLIQDNFLVPSTPAYSNVTTSSAALVAYLNECLADARAENASSAYAYIRLSADAYLWSGHYSVGMSEASTGYPPVLDYTTVTVPLWLQVPIGGGGFVTGLVGDATGSDIYARTDVGGLYKWNSAGSNWTNITDKIVPTTTRWSTINGLLSTMSVAIDPSNANNVYIAVGGGSVSSTKAGIYASADKGLNWTEITTGTPNFSINGNADRAGGERLAVDPNNSNIVWYGSENHGLMKGVKSGSVWTWSQVSSASVPFGTAGNGIRFVVCDKDGANTTTYAGVLDSSGSTGGVYKTTDGTNWSKVTAITLAKPSRASVASDGTLYVTGYGAVIKLTRAGVATTITPGAATLDYRGLAISPDGSVVSVANVNAGTCEIWRSTGGGASGTWKTQSTAYFNNWNFSASRIYAQEPDGTPCNGYQWFGNVAALWINPANTNELWASDFYGVQRTQQADRIGNTAVNTQPTWYRLLKNLEETLVFAARNAPSGSRVLSGVADVGGFRHATDTAQRPFPPNGGGLNGTSGKNITSIDFSESSPSTWAYAWAHDDYNGTGAVSIDGGVNWTRFGQITRKSITNSPAGGWETFNLGAYLSKQRAKGVTNVTLLVAGADKWWENTPSMSFESLQGTNQPRLVLNGGANTITVSADTYVSKTAPTANYGTSNLIVRGNGGNEMWSYLRFDLSSVATISDAQLELYRIAAPTETRTLEVSVNACAANVSWVEGNGGTDNTPAGEMNYNNRVYTLADASTGSPLTGTPQYRYGSTNLRGGRIAVSATDPNSMVWLPIGSPAYYSEDRGVTWLPATNAPASQISGVYTGGGTLKSCGQNLAADRVTGDFYIATFIGATHSVYRSTDGGKTWSFSGSFNNGGSYNMFTPQLVAAPASPADTDGGDLWFCDDSTYNENAAAGGLWRSTNAGQSWTKITNIGRISQVSFGKSPTGTGYTVYVHGENTAGVRGVYRSNDYGATAWTALAALPSTVPVLSLGGDRQNYNSVFLGTEGRGLFQYKQ